MFLKGSPTMRSWSLVLILLLLPFAISLVAAAQEPGNTNPPPDATPTASSRDANAAPARSLQDDVTSLKNQLKEIQDSLKQEKEDPDFSLVLGIGSLIVGPGVTDYKVESNVVRATNLGRATPQFLAGVAFRSRLPSLQARFRNPGEPPREPKDQDDPKYKENFLKYQRRLLQYQRNLPKYKNSELWERNPWAGFVSIKFSPDASQAINGYVIGGLYSITHYLNALIGFALTPVNEPAPGFRLTASQFVAAQQAQGQLLNFDPTAMLQNRQNAFDGFSVTDATGRLIYQGSPTTLHYRGGAVFGVSIPIYFKSIFGGGAPSSKPSQGAPGP